MATPYERRRMRGVIVPTAVKTPRDQKCVLPRFRTKFYPLFKASHHRICSTYHLFAIVCRDRWRVFSLSLLRVCKRLTYSREMWVSNIIIYQMTLVRVCIISNVKSQVSNAVQIMHGIIHVQETTRTKLSTRLLEADMFNLCP